MKPAAATSCQLAATGMLYALPHKQDSTYHSLCYTSCRVLSGIRNSAICPPVGIDPTALRNPFGRKEGNVLFNDALNTFYLRSYGARHMVKDHR